MFVALIAIVGIGSWSAMPSDASSKLKAALANASSGALIKLAPGDYGRVQIVDKHWNPAITIEAGRSKLGVTILRSSGISFRNGVFGNGSIPGMMGRAVSITSSANISFDGALFADARIGVAIDQSKSVRVSRSEFRDLTADGIDIASSQAILVEGIRCHDFIASERHPDCVQMWSRPGKVTTDVTIRNNVADGRMQGFTGFNHIQEGVDDGGFDRIKIIGNTVHSINPNGVTVNDCRDCVIADNMMRRLPDARFPIKTRAPRCLRCDVRANRDDYGSAGLNQR